MAIMPTCRIPQVQLEATTRKRARARNCPMWRRMVSIGSSTPRQAARTRQCGTGMTKDGCWLVGPPKNWAHTMSFGTRILACTVRVVQSLGVYLCGPECLNISLMEGFLVGCVHSLCILLLRCVRVTTGRLGPANNHAICCKKMCPHGVCSDMGGTEVGQIRVTQLTLRPQIHLDARRPLSRPQQPFHLMEAAY